MASLPRFELFYIAGREANNNRLYRSFAVANDIRTVAFFGWLASHVLLLRLACRCLCVLVLAWRRRLEIHSCSSLELAVRMAFSYFDRILAALPVSVDDTHTFHCDGGRYDGSRSLWYAPPIVFGRCISILGRHFDAANDILRTIYHDFIDF